MGSIKTAMTVANYQSAEQRGLDGCHNCKSMRLMPSHLGFRRPECTQLGCGVSPMAICKYHQPTAPAGAGAAA